MPLKKSLGFRLCIVLGVAFVGILGLFAAYFLEYESRRIRETAQGELLDLSGIVLRNTKRSMQANHPEGIEDIIRTVGEQREVLSVRIYTRDGVVRYSSDPQSLGLRKGLDALSCKVCHTEGKPKVLNGETPKLFSDTLGNIRAVAVATPILGEPGCYQAPCHWHPPEHKMLGILEIYRSLEGVETSIRDSLKQVIGLGLILFIFGAGTGLIFILRSVHRPVRELVASARGISQGNYDLKISLRAKDELGELAAAFNEMSQRIQERERSLFESREEFRTLFNEVPAHVIVVDPSLVVRNANRLYLETFGDRRGRPCHEPPFGQGGPCGHCPALRAFEDGLVHSMEQRRGLPNGRTRDFLVSSAPIKDQGGRVRAVMEIFTDITHIRELQRKLVLLGETVAAISHTIKNILGGLEGGIYVVDSAMRRGDRDLLGKGWDMVKANVGRISRLVRDILYLSKEKRLALEETDPAFICREVVELLASLASQRGVVLKLEEPGVSKTLLMDPMGIHTVLMDLVTNAIEAFPNKNPSGSPHVVLRCTYGEGDKVIFEVEDNGPGIPPELQGSLFIKSVTTKGSKGTGLGLLVVNKIVSEHGGQISMRSSPEAGTVFRVEIPAREPSI